ncbi:MAG: carboxypeptidase regulatory-like domain-containing protein [Acidobacteria bacterium]|nr:carboxypeptidase regulatory-like domain-containing protein [Acidobacteriota bacterium]
MNLGRVLILLCFVICASAPGAHAQVSAGAILGTVSDITGAHIPGVTITVTNEGTNQSRQAITNETGNYRVEPLQIGRYTISAELEGFRKEVRNGVNVEIDARVRMDFVMQVGEVTEVLEVTAQAPLVQTDDSQVGQIMDQRKIVDLPLNGRNFAQLAYLTPGTFAPRPNSHLSDRGGFVAVGMEEKTNQYLVDGVNNNGAGTMELGYRVNIDTVAEFKIQSQNYNAQYGRYAGAQVDAILKSGTNQFHGTAFAFTRNDNLDARNFFDPWPITKKPEFKRHQYGATFGGPIQQNRAFFFVGFQGQRQTWSRTTNPTVPFPEFWSGDLSRINGVIRDPLTGQPFPNNRIPAQRLDPIALKFRPYFFIEPARDTLSRNATAFLEEPEHFWQLDGKVSWTLSTNHQLMGSYGIYDSDLLEWRIAGQPELPNYMTDGKVRNQRISLTEVWTISPTLINEFRAGISRVGRDRFPYLRDRNYARDVFGIPGTVGDVDPIGYKIPSVNITGYSSVGEGATQPRRDGNWIVSDTLSMQRGNHAVKFGGDVFRQYMNLILVSTAGGSFTFNGAATGDPFADFLLGLPEQTSRGYPLGPLSQHPRRWSTNWFVQDDWKVRHNLAINYGLRYEMTLPLDEKWGKLSAFDPALGGGRGGIRIPEQASRFDSAIAQYQALYPTLLIERNTGSLYKTDKNNFAPRFGMAWSPRGGTTNVVRAGYGIFYTIDDLCFCGSYNQAPFVLTQRFTRRDGPSFQNPWPGIGVSGTISMDGVDPNLVNAYYQHWNLDVQTQLPMGVVLDVGYIGKKGTKLDASRDINQPVNGVKPYPLFGPISYLEPRGSSIYHGLQLRVEKRSTTGLNILTSYAWGKLIDNLGSVRDSFNLRLERGLGTEHMKHRFTASTVYALPVGRGKRFMSDSSGVTDAILGGWEFSGIVRMNSGSPATPGLSIDNSGLGRRNDRPDIVGDWSKDSPHPTQGWWNRSAFVIPPRGSVGNAGKGSLIGPSYAAADLSALKRFQVEEGKSLQFRFEIFNALNHANFYPLSTTFDSSNFGTTGVAYDGRQIQLGLKYLF